MISHKLCQLSLIKQILQKVNNFLFGRGQEAKPVTCGFAVLGISAMSQKRWAWQLTVHHTRMSPKEENTLPFLYAAVWVDELIYQEKIEQRQFHKVTTLRVFSCPSSTRAQRWPLLSGPAHGSKSPKLIIEQGWGPPLLLNHDHHLSCICPFLSVHYSFQGGKHICDENTVEIKTYFKHLTVKSI